MKKLKIIALISGVLTAVQLFPVIIAAVSLGKHFFELTTSKAGAVGIIGGADGPTAIYYTSITSDFLIIARYVFLVICVLTFIVSVALLIKNRNKK